jgi:hypothetical protein
MRVGLRKWMDAAEFRRWEAQQVGRPVATGLSDAAPEL